VRYNTNVTALAKTATGIAATLTDGSVEEYDVVSVCIAKPSRIHPQPHTLVFGLQTGCIRQHGIEISSNPSS
jgi:hypothetical protein